MNNIIIPHNDFVMFLRLARKAIERTKEHITENPEIVSDFHSTEVYIEELARLNDVARSLETISKMNVLNLRIEDIKELDIVQKEILSAD